MRDIALLFIFCPMLVMAIRHVYLGTLLWIWTALAGPNSLLYGIAMNFPFNKAAAAITFIAILFDQKKKKFFLDGFFVFFTLFVIQGIISFTFALTEYSRLYDLLDKMLKIWTLCAIMRIASRDRIHVHAAVCMFTLALGLHGILEGLKYIASGGAHKAYSSPVIGDNNYLALATLMILPFMIYLYGQSVRPLLRSAFAFMGAAAFVGVIATASRGGLVGLVVFALMLIFQSKRKWVPILATAIVAIVLVVVAPSRWVDRMETIKTAENDNSFMSRVISWKMNTILALDRPFLGGGYSALEDGRVHQAYLPQFSMLDFIPTDPPTSPLAAHSIYFSVLGDLGFIGLILFLSMLGTTYSNIRKISAMARHDPDLIWAGELAVAFQRSLVLYLIVGAALSAAYFEILYIQASVISILCRSMLEQRAARKALVPGTSMVAVQNRLPSAPPNDTRRWVAR